LDAFFTETGTVARSGASGAGDLALGGAVAVVFDGPAAMFFRSRRPGR
jgi:hypothetical protein